MAPVVMTNVIAVATMMVGAICLLTLTRFPTVRKASARRLKKANNTTKTRRIDNTPKCRATNSDRAPWAERLRASGGGTVSSAAIYLPIMEFTSSDRLVSAGAISRQTTPS